MSIQAVNLAVKKECDRLREMPPTVRARACVPVTTALLLAARDVASVRREAMVELREVYGWTYRDLGREFGVNKARVQQLVDGAKRDRAAKQEKADNS